jgi:hypothetical protein
MCRASSSGQCNLLRPKSMANLKWHSAAICLEAKEPVATAGLRLAREQSLTVRLLNLLTIANTPSTTTVLDSPFLLMLVTSSSYTTCLLPYRPAITFRSPHCCSSSDPSLWVRQPSPPYDCSPIAVLKPATNPLRRFLGHCNCNHIVLRSSQIVSPVCSKSSCVGHDECTIVNFPSLRLPNEASSATPRTKLTYPILENNRANWTCSIASSLPMILTASGNAVGKSQVS